MGCKSKGPEHSLHLWGESDKIQHPHTTEPTHKGTLKKNQTLHITPQSTHRGESWKIKSPAKGIFRENPISLPPAPFGAPKKKLVSNFYFEVIG